MNEKPYSRVTTSDGHSLFGPSGKLYGPVLGEDGQARLDDLAAGFNEAFEAGRASVWVEQEKAKKRTVKSNL